MLDVKFGACEFALPGCCVGSVKLAKEVGLDGLELDFGSYERGFRLSQKWMREYYMEECEKYGIRIPSILLSALDIYGLCRPKGTEKGDMLYRILDMAAEAAIDMKLEMVMLPSFWDGLIKTEEDMENTAKALKYMCRMLAPENIMVSSENPLTIEENKKLLGMVGEENLRVFYDSQNYKVLNGWNQPETLDALFEADLLYPEIHVKDGCGDKMSASLLGEGDTDFYGTMQVLKKHNYKGWIHLENFYDRPPLNAAAPGDYISILKKDLEILKEACR